MSLQEFLSSIGHEVHDPEEGKTKSSIDMLFLVPVPFFATIGWTHHVMSY